MHADQAPTALITVHTAAQGNVTVGYPPAPHVARLRSLLPLAADLAALMQQYYSLPAVEAERQLALAQAAAGRSCAYLRCANLGGEGGAAAGQGVGSMRCRWAVGPVWAVNCVEKGTRTGRGCLLQTSAAAHAQRPGIHASAPPSNAQRLPRGVVLRHRLLAR